MPSILPLLILLLASLPTLAQDNNNPEVPAIGGNIISPPPALPPGIDPALDPAPQPQTPADLAATLIIEPIEQPKLSGNDLAALYRKYTGHRVIVSSAAALAEFAFIQPASPQDPLTYQQAADLLKKAATIENFIFVPDGKDPSLEYLTLPTAGIKPTAIGVGVFTEKDILPQSDAVISYVMNLSYIKPDEAVRTFTQIIGQVSSFGSIAAVPNAAAVVITENTSLIRKLIDLKAEIDKPSSQVSTRFITVKYADVTELATTLNELLGTTSTTSTSTTAGIQRQQQQQQALPAATPDFAPPGPPSAGETTPIQIIPDARTNRVFVMGRPIDLLFVDGLIRQFDTQSDQRNFLRRKLKFLAVADFLPIAGDALTRAFTGTGTGTGTSTPTAEPSPASQANNNNTRQQPNQNPFNNNNNQGSGNGSSSTTRGSSLADPQTTSAPQSLLVGRTLLVADNITNSIVVQGPPSGVEIIENLLDQVDVKADQVMISTVFGQLSLGNNTRTGVDWLRAFRGSSDGGLGASTIGGGTSNNFLPRSLTSPATGTLPGTGIFPNQIGLSLYGQIGTSLATYINLLSTDTDFTILSRPSIFTANNQKGTISSGRRIAVPTSSNQFNNSFSTNIEYRDVVLKLEVIPLVNSQDEITLQIALVSDDIVGSTPIQGVGDVPIIGTRELLTTVTVPNNQTIILGGLITTNDTKSSSGIPILSDIPGLGRLFSTKNNGQNRDELMIFIQPSIVTSDRSLDSLQNDMDQRYQVAEPSRTLAEPSTLLPIEIPENISPTPTSTPSQISPPRKLNRKPLIPQHRR